MHAAPLPKANGTRVHGFRRGVCNARMKPHHKDTKNQPQNTIIVATNIQKGSSKESHQVVNLTS